MIKRIDSVEYEQPRLRKDLFKELKDCFTKQTISNTQYLKAHTDKLSEKVEKHFQALFDHNIETTKTKIQDKFEENEKEIKEFES